MKKLNDLKNLVENNTVFIIGGGNSLRGFDFDRLRGKCVVALNSAYKFVGEDSVLYWMDQHWAKKQKDSLSKHPSTLRFTSYHTQVDRGPYDSFPLRHTGDYGYDPDIGSVRGNNSGTQALNLVVNMNPKRVILLGYDMGYNDSKSHFHDLQPPSQPDVYVKSFIPSLESLAKEISHVEVINCSSVTAITCFLIDTVDKYL